MQPSDNEGSDGRRAWCLDLLAESIKALDAGENAQALGWLSALAKGLGYQRIGSWREKLEQVLGQGGRASNPSQEPAATAAQLDLRREVRQRDEP